MALTDFTSYEEVRAALGVSGDELEDTTLGLNLYADHLAADLEDISLTLIATYKGIADTTFATRTDAEQRLFRSVRMFSTYSVAKHLLSSLPMFGPKDISDGKATISRFADSPYRAVTKEVKEEYERTLNRLRDALAALTSSTVTPITITYLSVVSPSTDPVVE